MVLEEKVKPVYDEDWDDMDKAKYDELVVLGRQMLGKEIPPANESLIYMSARMTINQMKGKFSDLTQDQLKKIKRANNRAFNQLVHETPVDNEFYYSSNNPMNKTDDELYDANRIKPDDIDDKSSNLIIEECDPDNYLVQQTNKMLEID